MFIITHCLHKFKFYKTSCYHIIISISNFSRQSFLLYKIFTHDCIAIDKICISDDKLFDEFSIPDAIKISDLCQWLRRQKVQQHPELLGAGVISVRQVILNRNMFTGELVTSWVSWQTHLDIKLKIVENYVRVLLPRWSDDDWSETAAVHYLPGSAAPVTRRSHAGSVSIVVSSISRVVREYNVRWCGVSEQRRSSDERTLCRCWGDGWWTAVTSTLISNLTDNFQLSFLKQFNWCLHVPDKKLKLYGWILWQFSIISKQCKWSCLWLSCVWWPVVIVNICHLHPGWVPSVCVNLSSASTIISLIAHI